MVVVAAGLAAGTQPGNPTGTRMVLTGFLLLAGTRGSADAPLPFTLGALVSPLAQGVFEQLLLAFPEGRLHSRAEKLLVAVTYLDVTVGSTKVAASYPG